MKYSREWYLNNPSWCRACGVCKRWHERKEDANVLAIGDCDKIPKGTEWHDEETQKTYTYDGYSIEDEVYDEVFGCFEEVEEEYA